MRILDIEQGSPEWFMARLGLPTASNFDAILATGKGRLTYLRKLAAEVITGHTGQLGEQYTNVHMERGKQMEPQAREAYCFVCEPESIQQVGFVIQDELNVGCSPDAMLGNDGLLEIKTKLPHLLIDVLHLPEGEFPAEHKAQCQGGLWICEREWIDLVVYWPAMPMKIIRAYRDDEYIKTLAAAVAQFNEELAGEVEWLKSETRQSPSRPDFPVTPSGQTGDSISASKSIRTMRKNSGMPKSERAIS